ncbi:MAG: rhodanese-like domain-containing protein [Pseudomonadota bacterium]
MASQTAVLPAVLTAALLATGLAQSANALDLEPLIDPETLASVATETVILDIRAPAAFAKGHLEGAVNTPYPAWRGPKDNPGALLSEAALDGLLSGAGITPETPVVVSYAGKDVSDFGAAARVYWTLKSAGVEEIAILNGGLAAWSKSGRALTTEASAPVPSGHDFSFDQRWAIEREGVDAVIAGEAKAILIDARPNEFFTGATQHPLAAFAGTLADALNINHERFFSSGNLLDVAPEAALAAVEAEGWTPGTTVVSFCNTGHWAATNWFVISEVAGIEGVKLYPESLVGWTNAQTN